jgi:hypothetical protein
VGGWSKLPLESGQTLNFSLLEELGAAAVEDPELAGIVQETEHSTPELSDEIRERVQHGGLGARKPGT